MYLYTLNFFNDLGQGFVDLYKAIKTFFIDCWHAYFDFVTGLFGQEFAKGFTIVIVFVIVALIFLTIIKNVSAPNK